MNEIIDILQFLISALFCLIIYLIYRWQEKQINIDIDIDKANLSSIFWLGEIVDSNERLNKLKNDKLKERIRRLEAKTNEIKKKLKKSKTGQKYGCSASKTRKNIHKKDNKKTA